MIPTLKAQPMLARAERLRDIAVRLDEIAEVRDRILEALADEPPAT